MEPRRPLFLAAAGVLGVLAFLAADYPTEESERAYSSPLLSADPALSVPVSAPVLAVPAPVPKFPPADLNAATYARTRLLGEANVVEPLHARKALLKMQASGFQSLKDLYVRRLPLAQDLPYRASEN